MAIGEIWRCSTWLSTVSNSCSPPAKLRGCDVVALGKDDVAPRGYAVDRATVRQKKTGRPVKFEITEQTREAIDLYLKEAPREPGQFLFPGRGAHEKCLSTRQYARLLSDWLASIGLDPSIYGTHSLRRTVVLETRGALSCWKRAKHDATLIYKRTGNLRAVQLLLGHTKIASTVRYLGIEVDVMSHMRA